MKLNIMKTEIRQLNENEGKEIYVLSYTILRRPPMGFILMSKVSKSDKAIKIFSRSITLPSLRVKVL